MRTILFFDGICNLCNAWVDFIGPRLRKQNGQPRLYFASLQGKTASQLLDLKDRQADSVLILQGEILYRESDAIGILLGFLKMPWPLFRIFWIIPRGIRNSIYRWIALNRYRWFGQRTECRVPTSADPLWLREHFLE